MAGTSKAKENTQLIGGLITLVLAVALLVGTVVCIRRCVAEWPVATKPAATQPQTTQPPGTVAPTLAANPYGPGDFAYDDGYLTCLAGESWLGVDVSEYQGVIDWQKVADAGVKFAIIRVGFRAWGSQGALHADACWAENLKGAKEAGLRVGVYFFSQAISEAEAREEAWFLLSLLDGAQLDMPIVFDWETVPDPDARTAYMTASKLNACAMAFCREIEVADYVPMVYFNQDMAKRMYDLQAIQDEGYGFWLAMYSDVMTYPYQLTMWQYTSGGKVPGISTNVDLNLYFTYDEKVPH